MSYMDYYMKNKQLDKIYIERYGDNVKNYYEKNCLELIVELAELCNESKCFKYWTVKKPNRELVLEEYADCMSMLMCILSYHGIEELLECDRLLEDNIVSLFNEIIRKCTLLMDKNKVTKEILGDIYTDLLGIGRLLNLNDDEILNACNKKYEKNLERLSSNY